MDNQIATAGAKASAPNATQAAAVSAICALHRNAPGALIEILHDVQLQLGYVPDAVLPVIANALNLSRAEVYGVRTFYHDFRTAPAGKHVLKLCQAEACQAMGSDKLAASVVAALGVDIGNTSANGAVTVEAVYCLGNCALAPAAMLDGKLMGRVTAASLAPVLSAGSARSAS
jgi:formate dehydrogenase subunit gamma